MAELRKNFTVKECSLGTDPHEVLPEEGVYAPVVKAGSDEKNIFTCVVRKTDNDFMAFTQHRGKVFVVEKIPSFNLMSIKYLLPMVGGKIDGYYDVVRIGFTEKDNKPALRLRLGEYHSLGDKWVHIYGTKMQAGELISLNYTVNMYEN